MITNINGLPEGSYWAVVRASSSNSGNIVLYDEVNIQITTPQHEVPDDPQFVNRFQGILGSCRDAYLENDIALAIDAYLPENNKLYVVDVSDFSQAVVLGSLVIEDDLRNVTGSGDLAVTTSNANVYVVNVSDPSNPFLMSTLYGYPGSSTYELGVTGSTLCMNCFNEKVVLVDLSNPSNPVVAGNYEPQDRIHDIAVEGDYLYVSVHNDGLYIVDIQDPVNPIQVSYIEGAEYSFAVDVCGDWALYADGYGWSKSFGFTTTLHVIDVSDPHNPEKMGDLSWSRNEFDISIGRISIFERYAYIWLSDVSEFYVVDFSDPIQPEAYDHAYILPGNWVISGDRGVFECSNLLHVINIEDPVNPVSKPAFDVLEITQLEIVDDYMFCLNNNPHSFVTVRLSDPENPEVVRAMGIDVFKESDQFTAFEIENNIACFVSDSNFCTVDISDPENPVLLSNQITDFNMRLLVRDNYVYILGSYIKIYDIMNPSNPVRISEYPLPGITYGLCIKGNYLFTCDNFTSTDDDEYHVIDISDPYYPQQVALLINMGATDLVIKANYLYAWRNRGMISNFDIIDITNPEAPYIAGSFQSPGEWYCATFGLIDGNYGYFYDDDFGWPFIMDMTDPLNPLYIGTFEYEAYREIYDIDIRDNYAYLSCEIKCVEIHKLW